MPEQMNLDEILNDKPPVEKPAAPAPVPASAPAAAPEVKDPVETQQAERNKSIREKHREIEQAAQGRVRDPETGQFVAKDETKAEVKAEPAKEAPSKVEAKPEEKPKITAPQQELTEKEKAFLRAAHEERGKRQELERRLAAIEAAKTSAEPAKTFYDDPEGALAKHTSEIKHVALQSRLEMADFIGRQKYPDYDEKITVFKKIAEQTPGLAQEMISSPNPGEFAYIVAKNKMQLDEAGSIDGLRAKIEKETRLKLETELREKADALAKERAALPPSLSEVQSKGVNRPVWSGPPSLDEILKS